MALGCVFCESRSRKRAQECEAWVSQLDDEGVNNSALSVDFERAIAAIGDLAPGIPINMDSFLVRVALRNCLLASEVSVKAERDRLTEKLYRYKMNNGYFKKIDIGDGRRGEGLFYVASIYEEKSCYKRNRERTFSKIKRRSNCTRKMEIQ